MRGGFEAFFAGQGKCFDGSGVEEQGFYTRKHSFTEDSKGSKGGEVSEKLREIFSALSQGEQTSKQNFDLTAKEAK